MSKRKGKSQEDIKILFDLIIKWTKSVLIQSQRVKQIVEQVHNNFNPETVYPEELIVRKFMDEHFLLIAANKLSDFMKQSRDVIGLKDAVGSTNMFSPKNSIFKDGLNKQTNLREHFEKHFKEESRSEDEYDIGVAKLDPMQSVFLKNFPFEFNGEVHVMEKSYLIGGMVDLYLIINDAKELLNALESLSNDTNFTA